MFQYEIEFFVPQVLQKNAMKTVIEGPFKVMKQAIQNSELIVIDTKTFKIILLLLNYYLLS